MRDRRPAPSALAALLAGVLMVVAPAGFRPTGATFSDTAPVTTGELRAGRFVPAAANAVTCGTSGTLLNPASTITFTTPLVAAPPRGTVQYVLRLYRTDVVPPVQVGEPFYLMTVGATSAAFAFDGGGLTLLQNSPYQARITTRLTEARLESSPARTQNFTNTGLLIANFVCGTGT